MPSLVGSEMCIRDRQDAIRKATKGPADENNAQHKRQRGHTYHMLQVRRPTQTKCLQDQEGGCNVCKVQQAGTHDEGVPEQERQTEQRREEGKELCPNDPKHRAATTSRTSRTTTRIRKRSKVGVQHAPTVPLTSTGERWRGIPCICYTGHRLYQDHNKQKIGRTTQAGAVHELTNTPSCS